MVAAVATVLAYLPGSGRAFGYDESVTVGYFVRTSSLLDPFRRQVVYNNHVLFSFLDHALYTVTGSHSELVLRLPAIVCAGLAVGILVVACGRRLGLLAGLAAGAFLATNPMFMEQSRQARGYSLLALCAVGSTVLLLDLLREAPTHAVAKHVGYVLLLAAGLATHLYMAFVLLIHVAVVSGRRQIGTRWWRCWLAVSTLALMAYAGILQTMLETQRGRQLQPRFPIEAGRQLLGGHLATLIVSFPLVVFALWRARRTASARAVAGALLAALVVIWLLAAPIDLYPRFFVWAVPAVAVAIAVAVADIPWVAPFLAGTLVLGVRAELPHHDKDPLATRQAARVVETVLQAGRTPCVAVMGAESLVGYTQDFKVVQRARDLQSCDAVIFVLPSRARDLEAAAARRFAYRVPLPAATPGVAYSNTTVAALARGPE